jgi:hypothetical protein
MNILPSVILHYNVPNIGRPKLLFFIYPETFIRSDLIDWLFFILFIAINIDVLTSRVRQSLYATSTHNTFTFELFKYTNLETKHT